MAETAARTLQASYIPMMAYSEAWELQKAIVREIDKGERGDTVLLLQHPPTYTVGSQKHPEHLLLSKEELAERGIGLFQIDRGGDITYHGPGQLVGYPMLYLDTEGLDLHAYLRDLEEVIIRWLAGYGIIGGRKPEFTGVWVGDLKIAAIGVKFNKCRSRRGFITSHGFALNLKSGIAEDGFRGIVPCGIQAYGVTSFEDLAKMPKTPEEAAAELLPFFCDVFGFRPADLQKEPAKA